MVDDEIYFQRKQERHSNQVVFVNDHNFYGLVSSV